MNINVDEPDFFNPQKTTEYDTFDENKKTKYYQHARIYWGFVEDIIRKDYSFESYLSVESFVSAYRDTIKDCIYLHHAWLRDNKDKLFNYSKFRIVLKKQFTEKLKQISLEL